MEANTNDTKINEKIIADFTDLLAKSEGRIDRTNEMIFNCVALMNKLTSEYCNKLDTLQNSRDEIINENKRLLNIIDDLNKKLDESSKRYSVLLDKLLTIVSYQQGKSENNIHVK